MSDDEIEFDDSQVINELRLYVKDLRSEYDDLRNQTRKVQARFEKAQKDLQHARFQLSENKDACAKLQDRRQQLNEQYRAHQEGLEDAKHRFASWSFVLDRTKHNGNLLKQRVEMARHQLKKSKHGRQIAWKLAQQAKVKLDAAEAQKQSILEVFTVAGVAVLTPRSPCSIVLVVQNYKVLTIREFC